MLLRQTRRQTCQHFLSRHLQRVSQAFVSHRGMFLRPKNNRPAQKAGCFRALRSPPAEHISLGPAAARRRASALMHSCTCRPFPRPRFLSPLSPLKSCVSPLTTSPTPPKTAQLGRPASLPAFNPWHRKQSRVSLQRGTRCSLMWLCLHDRSPTHTSRSSLPLLSRRDTWRNIVPSRSPPDLTSRLLLIHTV